MELKDQVVNLELSKKLKELGFKQESLFWWFPHKSMETHELLEWKIIQNTGGSSESCSAYTVAELGEMLPWMIGKLPPFLYLQIEKDHHGWIVRYQFMENDPREEVGDTLAEAMALMLIHLSEQGLTTNQNEDEKA